jgi:hypothetical protein
MSNLRIEGELVGSHPKYEQFIQTYRDFYKDMELNNSESLVFKSTPLIKNLPYQKRMYTLYKLHVLMTHNMTFRAEERDTMGVIADEIYQLWVYHSESIQRADFRIPETTREMYIRTLSTILEDKKETLNLFGENYTASIGLVPAGSVDEAKEVIYQELKMSKIGFSPEIKEFARVENKVFAIYGGYNVVRNRFSFFDKERKLEMLYILAGKIALIHRSGKVHNNITSDNIFVTENVANGIQNVFVSNSKQNRDFAQGRAIDIEQFGLLLWKMLFMRVPYNTPYYEESRTYIDKDEFLNITVRKERTLWFNIFYVFEEKEGKEEMVKLLSKIIQGIFLESGYSSLSMYDDFVRLKNHTNFSTKTHEVDTHFNYTQNMQVDEQTTGSTTRANKRRNVENP